MEVLKMDNQNLALENFFDGTRFLAPLYHGTDENVLIMTAEERKEMKRCSLILVECLYPLYNIDSLWQDKNYLSLSQDIQGEIYNALLCARAMFAKSSLFQYDSIYLTFNLGKAKSYASRAHIFGELGNSAYWLYYGAQLLNLPLLSMSDDQKQASETILAAAKKVPKPIILQFDNFDISRLHNEDDRPIDNNLLKCYVVRDGSVRVIDDLELNSGKILQVE